MSVFDWVVITVYLFAMFFLQLGWVGGNSLEPTISLLAEVCPATV